MEMLMNPLPYVGYSWYQLWFIFFFWSWIGWMIEVVDMTYETGEYQNRGFLNGPICPIYGVGVIAMLILFKPLKDTWILLGLASTVLCTAFEYFMGWGMEKLFHARWWDYSHMKFNLHGYICLRNSLFFGTGCVLLYHFMEPLLDKGIAMIPVHVGQGLLCVFVVLLILDTVASVAAVKQLQDRVRRIEIITNKMFELSTATGHRLADGTLVVKSGIDKAVETAQDVNGYVVDKGREGIDRIKETAADVNGFVVDKSRENFDRIKGTVIEINGFVADKSRENIDRIKGKAIDINDFVTDKGKEGLDKLKAEFEKMISAKDNVFSDRLLRAFPSLSTSGHFHTLQSLKRRIKVKAVRPGFITKLLTKKEESSRDTAEEESE